LALPKEKIHLGLDLQGGMHLILEVDTDKAIENYADRLAEELKDTFRRERIPFTKVERAGKWDVVVHLANAEAQTPLTKLVEKDYPVMKVVGAQSASDGSMQVAFTLQDFQVNHIRKMSSSQALETIRNRVDQFGVTEPDIRPQGENRILVQLPGVKDPQRAVALIGKTALLEFKLVAEEVTPQDIKEGRIPRGSSSTP